MTFGTGQFWATIILLVLALFLGSVDLFWIALWDILLSISALVGSCVDRHRAEPGIVGLRALGGIYALITIIQICALPRADRSGLVAHYDIALYRCDDKNEMPNS